jgi:acyl-CoA thioesterase
VPSITKIFEKILDLLLTSIRKDFPNVQQVAYQKLLSSMNASFNLQEETIHHVEKKPNNNNNPTRQHESV